MSKFRRLTADFAVAGQLAAEDFAEAAEQGYRLVLNNRPDGEVRGQMTNAEAETAARAAGLAYQALQFTGAPPPGVVAEVAALLDQRPGPVLAYCRTGARSLTAWAMAQALCGARAPDEIIALAKNAGYDLAGIRGVLARLAPS